MSQPLDRPPIGAALKGAPGLANVPWRTRGASWVLPGLRGRSEATDPGSANVMLRLLGHGRLS